MENTGGRSISGLGPGKGEAGGSQPQRPSRRPGGVLLPGTALQCHESAREAAVRVRIGCQGLIPTEEPKWTLQEEPWSPDDTARPGHVSGFYK